MDVQDLLKQVDGYLGAGKPDRAESILRSILTANPEYVPALKRLARAVQDGGNSKGADAILKRVSKIQEKNKGRSAQAGHVSPEGKRVLHILFFQQTPCIRNYKMAQALGGLGHKVTLAYINKKLSEQYPGLSDDVYHSCIRLNRLQDLWEAGGDYDLIHCHNEPDKPTVAALAGDTPVIHDTHDLVSLRNPDNELVGFFEGVANRGARGRIYTTPYQKREAQILYDIQGPSLVFHNYASAQDLPATYHPKLSEQDGELHFVYEGGISMTRHRDFKETFVEIAARGAHLHIYPIKRDEDLAAFFKPNPRIHYYAPVSPKQIMEEMTRYDIGIIPWNLVSGNKRFLDSTMANKLFEYLAAGLPVAASAVQSYEEYFANNSVGVTFRTVSELFDKLPDLKRMIREVDFSKQVYTFESEIHRVVAFYNQVLASVSAP